MPKDENPSCPSLVSTGFDFVMPRDTRYTASSAAFRLSNSASLGWPSPFNNGIYAPRTAL